MEINENDRLHSFGRLNNFDLLKTSFWQKLNGEENVSNNYLNCGHCIWTVRQKRVFADPI